MRKLVERFNKGTLAWHFHTGYLANTWPEEPIEVGKTFKVSGRVKLCDNGLHASLGPWNALNYHMGPFVSRVRLEGTIIYDAYRKDLASKCCATKRTVLWQADCTDATTRLGLDVLQHGIVYCQDKGISLPKVLQQASVDGYRVLAGLSRMYDRNAVIEELRQQLRDAEGYQLQYMLYLAFTLQNKQLHASRESYVNVLIDSIHNLSPLVGLSRGSLNDMFTNILMRLAPEDYSE